jgi:hypothetical protein
MPQETKEGVVTKGRLIELLYKGLPYSSNITQIDVDSEKDAIRFTWFRERFRASTSLFVEGCVNGMLCGNNSSTLIGQILNAAYTHKL